MNSLHVEKAPPQISLFKIVAIYLARVYEKIRENVHFVYRNHAQYLTRVLQLNTLLGSVSIASYSKLISHGVPGGGTILQGGL